MVMTHGTEKPELGWVREVDEEGRQAGPYSLQATAALNPQVPLVCGQSGRWSRFLLMES